MKAFLLSGLAALSVCQIWPGSAAAQTLIHRPYLQLGTPTSMIVRWETDVSTESVLRYGSDPGNLSTKITIPGPVTRHEIEVTNLDPSTIYYYSVGTTTLALAGGDADHYFVTSPDPGTADPVRIWVLGDSGQGQFGGSETVRDAYLSYAGESRIDVWLMLGDNAYKQGRFEEYQDGLFDVYPTLLRETFLWPIIGNHDRRAFDGPQNGPYLDLFDLPAHGESGGVPSTVEHFYSFDYGNIHFVVLDSEVASLEEGSAQIEWLERDLENNRSEWTLALVHVPPYSKGSHDSDFQRRHHVVRGDAVPILEAHGVDLVLSGHSHGYERSHLIRGHYGPAATWDASTHLVDGGDGCPPDEFKSQCSGGADGEYVDRGTVYTVVGCSSYFSSRGDLDHPVMASAMRTLGSLVIDVEGERLEARFLQADGEISDRFVIRHSRTETAGSGISGPGDRSREDPGNDEQGGEQRTDQELTPADPRRFPAGRGPQ